MQATRERPLHMQAPDLAPTIETAVRIQREFEEVMRIMKRTILKVSSRSELYFARLMVIF
jgi:hypothetical protein